MYKKVLLQNILMKMTNFLTILLKFLLYIIFYQQILNIRFYLKLNLLSLLILTPLDD